MKNDVSKMNMDTETPSPSSSFLCRELQDQHPLDETGESSKNENGESKGALSDEYVFIGFKDVCRLLGIAQSTGFDWRNPKSPRYKRDFPIAVYLSKRCVRFRQVDIIRWAESHKMGVSE